MKQYVTMLKIESGSYQKLETMNPTFFALTRLFSFNPFARPSRLIEWFDSDSLYFSGSSFVGVDKEGDFVNIYNLNGECMFDEDDPEDAKYLNEKFTMKKENFSQIIHQWEELRVAGPDIILIVIHEDNHVSLETDPVIIKQYQDAGYAFDIDKSEN